VSGLARSIASFISSRSHASLRGPWPTNLRPGAV